MNQRSAGEIDLKLGAWIRSRRLELNMSQEKLAEHLGVSFQQVQKYEKGVNRISATRLQAIAAVLNLDIGALFERIAPTGERGDSFEGPDVSLNTRDLLRLVTMYKSIKNPQIRRQVISLVEVLIENDK